MIVKLKASKLAQTVEVGDMIVTDTGQARIIISYRGRYLTLDPITGEACHNCTTIENLLEEHKIARVVKKDKLQLIEI